MLPFRLTRKWSGGLHFGPAGWQPAAHALPAPGTTPAANLPTDRPGLIALLEHLRLDTTSTITPSLLAQLHDVQRDTPPRRVRALFLNLLPTQPESLLPQSLIRQALPDLLAGLTLIRRCFDHRRTLAVIDRHDFRSLRLFRRGARKTGIGVAKLLSTYPQAHPTILLRSLAGKKLAPGMLPTHLSRVIIDPAVCYLLGRYVTTGQAPTERPVQLFAQGQPPRLLMASMGQTVADFCRQLRLDLTDRQVILNGMLAGEAIDPASRKIDFSVELISVRPVPRPESSTPCIECGWCVDHCPTSLIPIRLYDLALSGKLQGAEAAEARHCISCGLCSYVCPTRLPLTAQISRLREERRAKHA